MRLNRKYARPEWERRFLLERFPASAQVTAIRRIVDRYIAGTTLRLREQIDRDGETTWKLTQKLPEEARGAYRGMITTIYLKRAEFDVFAGLPATRLAKTRHSVPPFGIDVFEGELDGLVLAEAEFNSASEASELVLPPFIACEVSDDERFTGGLLATASRREIEESVASLGFTLSRC